MGSVGWLAVGGDPESTESDGGFPGFVFLFDVAGFGEEFGDGWVLGHGGY